MKDIEKNYYVDELGNVFCDKKYTGNHNGELRKLKSGMNNGGYLHVVLTINKKRYNKYVHRLIAQAFIPNPENKPCVNHINGIKTDNRVENLEWATQLENHIHASNMGLKAKGSANGNSKLTSEDVLAIRLDARSLREIAKSYGVYFTVIGKIKRRELWQHVN